MPPEFRRLVFGLPPTVGEAPPSEFRIFSYGNTGTTKGDYDFDEDDADECMAAYRDYGNRLTIDYEHQALNDPPTGPAPAAASFVLEKRTDGLWAVDVKWTPRAAEMLKGKEYLYFSPAFAVNKSNHPNRLLNVALTNLPATKNMTPLVAAKHTETSMKTVLTALSLKDSASEAEALSAVNQLHDAIRQVKVISGKDSLPEAIGALTAMKVQSERSVALAAELEQVRAEKAHAEVVSLLDEAMKDGRVTLATRPTIEALYKTAGIEAFKTCLSVLPKASAPAVPPAQDKTPAASAHGLSREQLAIIKNTGLTPEKWLEHKQKLTNATAEGK